MLALGLHDVATWIRHHHERWDGKGYPDGMAGERIPLPSRIIGASDALDAMTTARAYRDALSLEQATGELAKQAGKQFDPQVANCLIELLGDGTLSLSEEHRVVTSYTITPVNDDLASDDYQRIRRALFPGRRSQAAGRPRISPSPPRSDAPQRSSTEPARLLPTRASDDSVQPFGGIVDREPGEPHVDPLAAERGALGFEEPALTRPLGQRPVGAHDALPGNARVLARRHHRAGKAGRART